MDVPIWLRVLFAALYRMNALGHAEFGGGELAELIGTSATAGSLRAAIRKLKALGFIGEESTARCIVVHHG